MRWFVVVVVVIALVGCEGGGAVPGGGPPDAGIDAARGDCPDGETCSEFFTWQFGLYGTPPSDWTWFGSSLPTVVGGVQTYHAFFNGAPFDHFQVDLTGSGASVIRLAQPDIVTLAEADGNGQIRMLEPETGRLYARFDVSAAPVARVGLATRMNGTYDLTNTWVMVAGTPGEVLVSLYDADQRRLVDQRAAITAAPGDTATVEQLHWDRARVTAATRGGARLAVAAGDGSVNVLAVPMVEPFEVDDIRPTDPIDFSHLYQYYGYLVCFRTLAGTAPVANLPVSVGSPFAAELGLLPAPGRPGCYGIMPTLTGSYTITAHAGDLTKDFSVVVQ